MSFSHTTKQPTPPIRLEHLVPDVSAYHDDNSLAALLRISPATVPAWRCRYPDRLPPGFKIGRNWFYDKQVAAEWLAAKYGAQCLQDDAPQVVLPTVSLKRRGKPTKAETEAAKAAGLTVPALRAKLAGDR